MQVADAEAMRRFCDYALPGMLSDACGVAPDRAESVTTDVMARAESICGLSYRQQEVLAAPFFEESFDHEPDDASLWQKAVTTVVIRNSELEELHVDGTVDSGGITAITTFGLGPLSHLRAARKSSVHGSDSKEAGFASLEQHYPRAWACLQQLRDLLNDGGGRIGYRCPDALAPVMPSPEEIIEAPTSSTVVIPSTGQPAVVLSAIDPRFDQNLADLLEHTAAAPGFIVGISALSRISRNSEKQLRVLELLLHHHARVLTTNYLLSATEVWVRKDALVKPDSRDMLAGLKEPAGLVGAHCKLAAAYVREVENAA